MANIHFEGVLTKTDFKRHISHRFGMPAGITRIVIHMIYAPAIVNEMDNHLVLTVFDPSSARGSRHYPGDLNENTRTHHIEIGAHDATYGFIPGPIQSGDWSVMIHTNMVLPDAPVQYTIHISLLAATEPTQDAGRNMQAALFSPKPGPAWFRGDLHAHTFHSDGHWDVPDLIAAARERKLDFVTLSDHNTASALKQMRSLATPDLLTMGGIELTTFYGHALALGEGVREWIDWRVSEARSMSQIAAEVETLGGSFVIAHPMTDGDPICTGCDWCYDDVQPGNARHVEIWNSGLWTESNNEQALQLFYGWLNAGHREGRCLVATAGTDAHGPAPLEIKPGFNVVYADELSERAIISAIRRGHLYLSTGPVLELTAHNENGETAMMGDVLHGTHVVLTVCWDGVAEGDVLRVITNGEAHTLHSAHQGQHSWPLAVTDTAWCTVELRDAQGQMRAITNPIFLRS